MSAPAVLDDGALARHLAHRIPAQRGPSADRRLEGRDGHVDRRRRDALTCLTRSHDALCTAAVDASEVAAGLESAGLGDRQARAHYGVASVFELAELMFDATPRRPTELAAAPDPWRRPWWVHAVRGVLYAAPAVLYVVALHLVGRPVDAATLLLATVLGNAATQGLALLGHALLGRSETRAAATLLRGAVLVGVPVLATVTAVATWVAGLPGSTGLLLAGQAAYLVSATVLLVLEQERRLLLLLLPGVSLATLSVAGVAPLPRWLLLLALVATVLATAAAAARCSPRKVGERSLLAVLDRELLARAAMYAGAGAVTAALVAMVVLDAMTGRGSTHEHAVPLAMAPLVAGLGLADWLVHRLRSRAYQALAVHTSPRDFRRWSGATLRGALLLHACVLALGSGLIAVVLQQVGRPADPVLLLQTAALGVTAVVLLTCMVLLSLGSTRAVLLTLTAALVVDTAARVMPGPAGAAGPSTDAGLAGVHLAVALLTFAVLLPRALSAYGRIGSHR